MKNALFLAVSFLIKFSDLTALRSQKSFSRQTGNSVGYIVILNKVLDIF